MIHFAASSWAWARRGPDGRPPGRCRAPRERAASGRARSPRAASSAPAVRAARRSMACLTPRPPSWGRDGGAGAPRRERDWHPRRSLVSPSPRTALPFLSPRLPPPSLARRKKASASSCGRSSRPSPRCAQGSWPGWAARRRPAWHCACAACSCCLLPCPIGAREGRASSLVNAATAARVVECESWPSRHAHHHP